MRNKYTKNTHISTRKTREILRLFSLDKLIKEQYSDISRRELKDYFILFVFAILFLIVFASVLKFYLEEPYFTICITLGNTLWILGITYVSLRHLVSKNLLEEPLPTIPLKEEKGGKSGRKRTIRRIICRNKKYNYKNAFTII